MEGPQSRLWCRIPLAFCGSRSWSSVPYSGPLQVYPYGRRTLLWTIWVRHSLGWADGRICPHQRLGRKAPAWHSKGFHNAEGRRSSLDTIAGAKAVDEMGIKHDAQDFRSSVLRGHLVTNSHLWVEPGLVFIRLKWTESRWISGEQWMASRFPFTSQGLYEVGWPLFQPPRRDAGSKGQQREVISVGRHVKVRDGTVRHKLVKEGWEMTDPCGFPARFSGKAMGVLCKDKSLHSA